MKRTKTHEHIPEFLRFSFPELQIRDGPGEAKVNCPAHNDGEPSCSMNPSSGLWHCHACGAGGDLIDFYRELHGTDFSTTLNDLNNKRWRTAHMEQNATKATLVVHPYLDDHGLTAYEVLREIDAQGKTVKVWQRRPDGTGGYLNNLGGVTKTIYRRDEVAVADEIMLAEGEKDADRLRELGFTATCNPGGAGKWRDEYSIFLKGKRVTIFADNDVPGRQHAQSVAKSLSGIAKEVRVVTFDELSEKGDVSDWLDQGHTKEQLIQRIEQTAPWTPPKAEPVNTAIDWGFITGGELLDSSFTHKPLINGLLGEKEALLIVGGSGIGKSLMTNDIGLTAGLADERILWGRYPIPNRLRTLFIQAENADHAVQGRLKAMCKGNPSLEAAAREQLVFPKVDGSCRIQGNLTDDTFIRNVAKVAKAAEVKLIVVDPLISYAGADENDNTRMRAALDHLGGLMDETGASVILVHHIAKGNSKGVQGGRGAQSISDWAANIIKLDPAKGHEDGSKLEIHHQKARNFEPNPKKFTLQRTANLRYISAENAVDEVEQEKINAAVEQLKILGGSIDKQADFKAALMASSGKSETEVQRWITDAVGKGHIEVVPGPGKAKGYRIPDTPNPQPENAEAA